MAGSIRVEEIVSEVWLCTSPCTVTL